MEFSWLKEGAFDNIDGLLRSFGGFLWGWPLIIFVILSGIILTVGLRFIQFRAFFTGWKYILAPEEPEEKEEEEDSENITSLQAFINALSSSLGNGGIAGMATAMHSGGPGAAFWVFILGFFNMVLRFAEVSASTLFLEKSSTGHLRGGPMVYLRKVPGGNVLVYFYAFFCLLLAFFSGNAMQCNSIRLSVEEIVGPYTLTITFLLFAFLLYVMFGGAKRIMRASEAIIPVKVGLFFGATILLLGYHWAAIIPSLVLIVKAAFTPQAIAGGAIGFSVQSAMRFGFARGLNAVEAGLGNAGILFGATGSKKPIQSGVMSMVTAFISTHLVCFVLMLVFVASGVWDSGLTSTPLVIASYNTLFGYLGSWIVTFLSISFGMGVVIAYAFVGRECWLFLTNGRGSSVYTLVYCGMALIGSLGSVSFVWSSIDIIVACLIVVNVYGLLMLLPQMQKFVDAYLANKQS
jgi:AGCS family alanine or glycine:cation symporter